MEQPALHAPQIVSIALIMLSVSPVLKITFSLMTHVGLAALLTALLALLIQLPQLALKVIMSIMGSARPVPL